MAELRRPDGSLAATTIAQAETSLRLLAGWLPDRATLGHVSRRTAGEFVGALERLSPSHARDRKAAGLPLAKLIELYPAGDGRGLAVASVRRHISNIGGLWKWAIGRGLCQENPWERPALCKAKPAAHEPYTMADLQLLADALPRAPAGVAFVFIVSLYSGLRLGEVCTVDAIVLDGPVPYLDLSLSDRKTPAGKRRVPIHPALLPHLPPEPPRLPAATIGRAFTRWKRWAGVTRPRTDHHSRRKNVAGALEQAGVPESEAALILGHAQGRGITYGVYSPLGAGLARLADAVARIEYQGLTFPDVLHRPVAQLALVGPTSP